MNKSLQIRRFGNLETLHNKEGFILQTKTSLTLSLSYYNLFVQEPQGTLQFLLKDKKCTVSLNPTSIFWLEQIWGQLCWRCCPVLYI